MGLLTDQLVDYVEGVIYNELPPNVITVAKTGVLDWLGVTIAGSRHQTVLQLLNEVAAKPDNIGRSEVLGHEIRLHQFWAALINGMSSHVLDFDDAYLAGIIHPGGPVLTGLLAAACDLPIDGRSFLTAYVTGVEVFSRLSRAMAPEHSLAGWHATATVGTIATTAAVGKLLGLNKIQLHNAFGFAATQAGGLREAFGSMAKSFHVGKAAMNGLIAVQLAQAGLTASEDMLEGKNGFLRMMAGSKENIGEVIGDREDYQILSTIFKRYACCFSTHASVESAVQLHRKIEQRLLSEIRHVDVRVSELDKKLANIELPHTGLEAKFCIAFCVAIGLVRGKAGITDFIDEVIKDTAIKRVFECTKVNVDKSLSEAQAAITVTMLNGSLSEHILAVPGTPPSILSFSEVSEKFNDCSSMILRDSEAVEVAGRIEHLEDIQDVHVIFKNLCCL